MRRKKMFIMREPNPSNRNTYGAHFCGLGRGARGAATISPSHGTLQSGRIIVPRSYIFLPSMVTSSYILSDPRQKAHVQPRSQSASEARPHDKRRNTLNEDLKSSHALESIWTTRKLTTVSTRFKLLNEETPHLRKSSPRVCPCQRIQ
jgi:hypothetical protein